MADIFRSAFSYISSGIGGNSGENERGSELIGEIVDLGNLKLKVKKVIAEGGYGFVYVAMDTVTGKEYAVKRQVVSSDQVKAIKQEVAFLKQLKGHAHIIEFIGAAGAPPKQGAAEVIIVTELITGGDLVDIVNTQRLSPGQVLRVFHETCLAVGHMHGQTPPIIHRDLKVENLLLTNGKRIKLCDLGSATTTQLSPDHSWSATQRGLAEDEIQRNTTPMYRSPEMIDLYSNYPINEKSDVWALGCLLFKLCYQEHPFEDSAKLRILNANYHIPADDLTYTAFHAIIRACLVVEPLKRPSVDGILAMLYSIADKLGENLDGPHKEPLEAMLPDQSHSHSTEHQSQTDSGVGAAFQNTSQQAHKLFGMMRGGAENIFKNIKDTSTKVISSVQGSRSRPLDISYITSRILVMSFPYDTPTNPNQNIIEEVGVYLEETHPSQYLVFNLSGEQYDVSKLNGQVVDYEWPFKVVPPLESLVELCRQMDSWLKAEPQNVLVIHCKDGVHPSVALTTLYLLFLKALPSPQSAVRLFLARRLPEGEGMQISESEKRYMKYMADLVGNKPFKPHSRSLYILMLRLSSVPLYNESKNGCKPFVEIFIDGERVFTSCTKDNMNSIRTFTNNDGAVEIPVGVSVCGNLHVIVHHIKSVPVAKTTGMGMSAVKMFHLQFHSGFVPLESSSITFNRNELDGPAAKRLERFPDPFVVSLDLQVESSQLPGADIAWQQLPHPQTHPITCFSTVQEQQEVVDLFGGRITQPSSGPTKTTPINPEQGYARMKSEGNNIAVADLLGNTHQTTTTATPYAPYRDGSDSDSSSSDSSSSSSSSENEGNGFDPFNKSKTHPNQGGVAEGFFSNPMASVEEANLLGLGSEEDHEEEVGGRGVPPSSKQYDPFAMWETTPSSGPNPAPVPPTSKQDDPFSIWEDTATTAPSIISTHAPSSPTAPPTSSTNFDPFGVWDDTPATNKATPTPPHPPSPNHQMEFDPFASSPSPNGRDLLDFTSTTPTSYQTTPTSGNSHQTGYTSTHLNAPLSSSRSFENPKQSSKPADPFGDIWNKASGTNQGQKKPSGPLNSSGPGGGMGPGPQGKGGSNPSMTSRPMYQVGGYGVGKGAGVGSGNKTTTPGGAKGTGNNSRPRSVSPNPTTTKPNKFGPVPNKNKAQFDDLLDQNLFTKKAKDEGGSVPLSQLQSKSRIDKIIDPDRAKVAEWADGKEHNIRALISSLHTILWEGEKRWRQVGIHQLVEGDQVGKFFRKACLSVHPDKAQGKDHENLARAIFDELNDAYELFESSGSKSLY